MSDTHRFFGYGSLVNTATHDYPTPTPATLHGWRRVWCRTTLRDVAFLSAIPDRSRKIDGLVADVPGADWGGLDERERAYDRTQIQTTRGQAQVYSVATQHLSHDGDLIILLSYLDVVIQGYLHQFGEAGVARFFDTTDGWEAKILNDRLAPVYPRAQALSADETALVDDWLKRIRGRREAHV